MKELKFNLFMFIKLIIMNKLDYFKQYSIYNEL